MAIAILNQAVVDVDTNEAAYTVGGFNVPSGTSRLLMQMEYRGAGGTLGPITATVTHNGDAVSLLFSNAAAGSEDINTWWGHRQNPDIGTFNIAISFPTNAKGLKVWLLALDGERSSGSILGATASQRVVTTSTNTVGLGLTPSSSGTSLLLASLSIAQSTTLTSWTGTGFVEVATGQYTQSALLTSTNRYRLNAPGSANTISAVFGLSDIDIGGSLIEILAEATSVDVSGDIAFGLAFTGTAAVSGEVGGAATARLTDTSHINGRSTWTEMLMLQPDAAGVDRRIISAGPANAPNYTLDMVGNFYRWQYRLADGVVTVETGAGTQTTSPHVIALVHQPGNPTAYVNGVESVSNRTGNLRVGVLDIGAGGMAIGGHDQASPAPYTGLIGRYLAYQGAMTVQQIGMLTWSLLDPDVIWGYGAENDSQVTNRSPVAMPMLVEPDGLPSMTVTPRMVDPNGTQPTISLVTQGAHTTAAISGSQLVLTFERGWQGKDTVDYTISDVTKSSTGKISIDQRRAALLARNDAITVQTNGLLTFDPRVNDIGAGPLRVISVSTPTAGRAVIQADGRIIYTLTPE